MNIIKLDFEISTIKRSPTPMSKEVEDINEKYEKGYSRVVTETGSYKVALIKSIFSQELIFVRKCSYKSITHSNY